MAWLIVSELRALLKNANNFLTRDSTISPYFKFNVEGKCLGFIRKDMLDILSDYSNVFKIDNNNKVVILSKDFETPNQKSEAINNVLLDIKKRNVLPFLAKWRNENCPVFELNKEKIWFEIERSATGILGVLRYGVHVNGYCVKDGVYSLWIAKRSMEKQTFPGLLDNIVGGGVNTLYSLQENVVKECEEEANISGSLLLNLKPCSCLSYMHEDERGLVPEVIYCYDILLPDNFIPTNNDGEVESFSKMSVEEVGHLLGKPNFAFFSALVTLDFYFRHGLITPDECAEYYTLYQQLHIQIPFD